MSVIITGGAGFVGSKLALYLSSLGENVKIIDTLWFNTEKSERSFKEAKICCNALFTSLVLLVLEIEC